MIKMIKLKILVIGPCESGKTTIANLLAEATENAVGDYRPTQAVRILEFECQNLNVNNTLLGCEIELWDCSGNRRFEPCWPAVKQDAQGVVLVYNPSAPDHPRELELLHSYFVAQAGLGPGQCLLVAHLRQAADRDARASVKLSNALARLKQVSWNTDEGSSRLRADFSGFVETLLGQASSRSDQEELGILGSQRPPA
ncbi:intraflagellar transport protein 22 homolog [Bacillus rossius redtenbacheri]|uniref:intraflagellar transport protein 22 homolog n=1 Tax=Bacillus rossius redtenbacheri TaxID=93214 RepID=UPI002FDCDB18